MDDINKPCFNPVSDALFKKHQGIKFSILRLLKDEELSILTIKGILSQVKWEVKNNTIFKY